MYTLFDLTLQFCCYTADEEIFISLGESEELNRIIHAWIGFNYSLTQAQKTFYNNDKSG